MEYVSTRDVFGVVLWNIPVGGVSKRRCRRKGERCIITLYSYVFAPQWPLSKAIGFISSSSSVPLGARFGAVQNLRKKNSDKAKTRLHYNQSQLYQLTMPETSDFQKSELRNLIVVSLTVNIVTIGLRSTRTEESAKSSGYSWAYAAGNFAPQHNHGLNLTRLPLPSKGEDVESLVTGTQNNTTLAALKIGVSSPSGGS